MSILLPGWELMLFCCYWDIICLLYWLFRFRYRYIYDQGDFSTFHNMLHSDTDDDDVLSTNNINTGRTWSLNGSFMWDSFIQSKLKIVSFITWFWMFWFQISIRGIWFLITMGLSKVRLRTVHIKLKSVFLRLASKDFSLKFKSLSSSRASKVLLSSAYCLLSSFLRITMLEPIVLTLIVI